MTIAVHLGSCEAGNAVIAECRVHGRAKKDQSPWRKGTCQLLHLGQDATAAALVFHECIGWIDEGDVQGTRCPQQGHRGECIGSEDLDAILASQISNILPQQAQDPAISLYQEHLLRPAACRLKAHRAHACKEIQNGAAGQVAPKHVEDGLACKAAPRTRSLSIRRRLQSPRSKLA